MDKNNVYLGDFLPPEVWCKILEYTNPNLNELDNSISLISRTFLSLSRTHFVRITAHEKDIKVLKEFKNKKLADIGYLLLIEDCDRKIIVNEENRRIVAEHKTNIACLIDSSCVRYLTFFKIAQTYQDPKDFGKYFNNVYEAERLVFTDDQVVPLKKIKIFLTARNFIGALQIAEQIKNKNEVSTLATALFMIIENLRDCRTLFINKHRKNLSKNLEKLLKDQSFEQELLKKARIAVDKYPKEPYVSLQFPPCAVQQWYYYLRIYLLSNEQKDFNHYVNFLNNAIIEEGALGALDLYVEKLVRKIFKHQNVDLANDLANRVQGIMKVRCLIEMANVSKNDKYLELAKEAVDKNLLNDDRYLARLFKIFLFNFKDLARAREIAASTGFTKSFKSIIHDTFEVLLDIYHVSQDAIDLEKLRETINSIKDPSENESDLLMIKARQFVTIYHFTQDPKDIEIAQTIALNIKDEKMQFCLSLLIAVASKNKEFLEQIMKSLNDMEDGDKYDLCEAMIYFFKDLILARLVANSIQDKSTKYGAYFTITGASEECQDMQTLAQIECSNSTGVQSFAFEIAKKSLIKKDFEKAKQFEGFSV